LDDRLIANMDEAALRAVLTPKADGSVSVFDALRTESLSFLAVFSSAASFVCARGQANYAAACRFSDGYTLEMAHSLPYPVTIINWGFWAGTGLAAGTTNERRFAELGVESIEPREGLEALAQAIACGVRQVAVVKLDPTRRAELGIDIERRVVIRPPEDTAHAPASTQIIASTASAHDGGNAIVAPPSEAPRRASAADTTHAAPRDFPSGSVALRAEVAAYLKSVLGSVLKIDPRRIDSETGFDRYGVDSLAIADVNTQLET